MSGTSSSSPLVAGLALLVREALEKTLGRAPTYDELHKANVATAMDLGLPPEHQGKGMYQAGGLKALLAKVRATNTAKSGGARAVNAERLRIAQKERVRVARR